jgi:hypothetical protein
MSTALSEMPTTVSLADEEAVNTPASIAAQRYRVTVFGGL